MRSWFERITIVVLLGYAYYMHTEGFELLSVLLSISAASVAWTRLYRSTES